MSAETGYSVLLGRSPFRRRLGAVRTFLSDPKAAVSVSIVLMFIVAAIFAPFIAPYGELEQNRQASLHPPSSDFLLGTDRLGRDVFSRIVYGSRVSLQIAFVATGIAVLIGIPIGLIAGYARGIIDEILMRIVDAWLAFPSLIFLFFVLAIIGPGVTNVMIAIGLNSFPHFARLIRGQTLSLREADFVMAGRSTGASDVRILSSYILPNAIQPIIVQASLFMGVAVLAESGLSFLGIGTEPGTATWGIIIADGFPHIREHYWITIFPGVAIVLFVMAMNLLGDRLRDTLDPRLRGAR